LLPLACSPGASSGRPRGSAAAAIELPPCRTDAAAEPNDAGIGPDAPDDSWSGAADGVSPAIATVQDFGDFAGSACPGDSTSGTPFACSRGTNDPALPSMLALRGLGRDPTQFLRLASVTPPGDYDNKRITFLSAAPGAFPVIVADFDFRLRVVQDHGRADGLGFALLDTANYPTGRFPPPPWPRSRPSPDRSMDPQETDGCGLAPRPRRLPVAGRVARPPGLAAAPARRVSKKRDKMQQIGLPPGR
jgi:hypothetical protein